ncbi:MAG TPA: Tex family protein [Clostridia bacterium]
MDIKAVLSAEFNLSPVYTANIIELLDQGNTVPFIARYRKELTGACDDQKLREFADRLDYLRKFEARKEVIIQSLIEQNVYDEKLEAALNEAKTLTELEDIYRPYKPKKKTRATVAIAKGLLPLAELIFEQNIDKDRLNAEAAKYIDQEKGVNSIEEAISGALDIICEKMSDNADIRKAIRELYFERGYISTALNEQEKENERLYVYEMYKDYKEAVKTIPSHRILAINRGEKENCLNVVLEVDEELVKNVLYKAFVKDSPLADMIKAAADDAYDRLIKPSIQREVRADLFEKASEQAIKMFETNLRPLIMQPTIKNKVVMGIDPAYRTGCKIAVVDGIGKFLDKAVVYPTPPQNKIEEAKAVLKELIKKHKVELLAIGNGTASKETEIFVSELIKEMPEYNLSYAVVNEAGASVYSASKLGAEEFPDLEPAHRSAISIARRLQDPMAELVKIEPRSIGVGQYQHDMPSARLDSALKGTVEDCVNSVGVDVNTASVSLLSYVAGLNAGVAKNIIKYRETNGKFETRADLLKVPKLGEKVYQQCAGFLRIVGGKNILDNTAVHPESYEAAKMLLDMFNIDINNPESRSKLPELVKIKGYEETAKACGIGVPTLKDIIEEILKPGRDIRDSLPKPILRSDVISIDDLKEGMTFTGTVRNVIDFGVFVDIGVHQDGLVHISEIADFYIKHPCEVLSVGDIVNVKVIGVDKAKNRISLTMKGVDGNNLIRPVKTADSPQKRPAQSRNKNTEKELSLEESLKMLAQKFNRH